MLLGVNYTHGRGVTQDEQKALELFEEAEKMGIEEGKKFKLFLKAAIAIKNQTKLDIKTLDIFKEKAKEDGEFCMILGDLYYNGCAEYAPQSEETYKAAFQTHAIVYQKGYMFVCARAGLYYATGIFVPKNYQKALALFSHGAEHGIKECEKYKLILKIFNQLSSKETIDEIDIACLEEFAREDELLQPLIHDFNYLKDEEKISLFFNKTNFVNCSFKSIDKFIRHNSQNVIS
ncbi:MAG: hypothetical protein FADNKDHG_01618 [Holosporales bacterium]